MKSDNNNVPMYLYDIEEDRSSCGVGFLTRKDGQQLHDVLTLGHQALCAVPHRGGMTSEGVGDGAGISIDLSCGFFSKLVGQELKAGRFGVGNFFLPKSPEQAERAITLVTEALSSVGMDVLLRRSVPVNDDAIEPRGVKLQQTIEQWIFAVPKDQSVEALDVCIHKLLLQIEADAFVDPDMEGFYPLSLSAHTQVLKGRLNSWEIIPYYLDLQDPDHTIHTLFFHTRFSTNTDPRTSMAQPFRLMAHNGELNTDKKNRLSEAAVARARNEAIIRPVGQSDSCRLDQTLNSRVFGDGIDLVTAVVSMMPPAWENDETLSQEVRDMLAYFSLYVEKNDGPAALVFGNGRIIGARLDRLGLRPLRTVETDEYVSVMSEAGQITFDDERVIERGRIEAGGMLFYDHEEKRCYRTRETLEMLAAREDYTQKLAEAQVHINDLPDPQDEDPAVVASAYHGDLALNTRYVSYALNQETFKFMLDPMLLSGMEKISAMGYGNAINALADHEGGMARFFSQRFAQVTNPPLDSIREADGMTLRVALGEKPITGRSQSVQIVIDTPILKMAELMCIRAQTATPWGEFEMLYTPVYDNAAANEKALTTAIDALADQVVAFAADKGGIAIISDRDIRRDKAALPMVLVISAVNQRLIEEGLRLRVSLILESGQISSSHHIACALGFGASAVYPLAARMRSAEICADDVLAGYKRFIKASEKALMKTMGKVGLCTVESYSGGEFFEPNFLDTNDSVLKCYLPNMITTVGGVQFAGIAQSVADWHFKALQNEDSKDLPILGLFKERSEGAGHSYGTIAVRGFVEMTEEPFQFASTEEDKSLRLLTLKQMDDAFEKNAEAYQHTSYEKLSAAQINEFKMTKSYREFVRMMNHERDARPAALRDVLGFPVDLTHLASIEDFRATIAGLDVIGNRLISIRGLSVTTGEEREFRVKLTTGAGLAGRYDSLLQALRKQYPEDIESHAIKSGHLSLDATGLLQQLMSKLVEAPSAIELSEVQPAAEITPALATGAMSHGALVASAHEAVAHGCNMVGGMSNSGEGGEHLTRYGTLRASKIKQFASGRFGVWVGYLADPNLEEIEIKIGQGAKPGEGGQLPAPKVTVEIAAARGGTPGVELISPPPHHDTYSIEDLAQLIHDAKAARVRVIVKLVSSEGIGTIAVGVAKAGADVINVAGNTGGTGAAAVTSLKYTGRAAEIGLAEVHQALSLNGIRDKVVLRCSGAMQTGSDVVKAALLGGDSFEFGTTALMMLKCVMAKNCNVKCPAGLTTNPEVFDGDPRALAQYFMNIAHDVRRILAKLGLRSLKDACGRADLLHLIAHPRGNGQLDVRGLLQTVEPVIVANPTYLERDFVIDDVMLQEVREALFDDNADQVTVDIDEPLNNRNKSVGGQLGIDIERILNHELDDVSSLNSAFQDVRGRRYLQRGSVRVNTNGSAGQSYAAFCNDGMVMSHTGTCNDGVGKGQSGGDIVIHSPAGGGRAYGENVLIGNFALFGATGGWAFIAGQAGDRFAVRNSGSTAVVEGVGDFCAEYMTHGAVLNLGDFAKGMGNGMSGGFVYQYDPEGRLPSMASQDSVIIGSMASNEPQAEIHQYAAKHMLERHVEATGSALGKEMLENWDETLKDLYWLTPRALLQYQDYSEILATKTEKVLIEELASNLAYFQIRKLKKSWKAGSEVNRGNAPAYDTTDTEEMFQLINSWTVLDASQAIAMKKLGGEDTDEAVQKASRNLILTEDHGLMSVLAKYAKAAIADYNAEQLSALVANYRLNEFKQALSQRNVLSLESPGTYGWILYQSDKNRQVLGELPSIEALFARHALPNTRALSA